MSQPGKTRKLGPRRLSRLLAVYLSGTVSIVYTQVPSRDRSLDSARQPAAPLEETNGTATLRVTTREVLVDLIAIDDRGQPATDLHPGDLDVSVTSDQLNLGSEEKHRGPKTKNPAEREVITSLRRVDPNARQPSGDDAHGGFQIGATCLVRAIQHYQLAFHPGPEGWRSGNHKVAIKAPRRRVRLIYRPQYYVGLTAPKPGANRTETVEKSLRRAACKSSEMPPSISLRTRWITTRRADLLRYSVSIDADSLTFVTLENGAPGPHVGIDRGIALDYGVCTFNSRGDPTHFYQSPLDTVLTSAEYARALDRGFSHILEFSAPRNTAMMRLVVRDRQTGNLGAIDVPYPRPAETLSNSQTGQEIRGGDYPQVRSFYVPALQVRIGSFGSIVPNLQSFCGDIYELPAGLERLPDFRYLDSIGSVYTPVLDVPNQVLSGSTAQIPGITPSGDPFGVDYHGVLWITKPGKYGFQVVSDDGAVLRVDDKDVIDVDGTHPAQLGSDELYLDAGRHSIEVRYYEDGLGAIALRLMIKQPDASAWTLLDTRDYAPPSEQ